MTAAVRQARPTCQASRCARGRQDRAAYGGGLWPVLTVAARSASNPQAGTEKPRTAEPRNCKRSLRWNTSALLCGCATVLRIKERLLLQQDTSQTKQSIRYTSERTAVRVTALA